MCFILFVCLQTMTDVVGNPEEERRADFFYQPWSQEAVCRYFYGKVCATLITSFLSDRPLSSNDTVIMFINK
jgi:hypothetical protein